MSSVTTHAQGGHEYASLEEKTISFKNFSFKSLGDDGTPVELRQWMADKKLVLVVYFAQWCRNWHNEAAFVDKLAKEHGPRGLGVIAVSEYAAAADAREHFGNSGPAYTVVVESESPDDRDKTTHYAYRQASGDRRRWGSPYHVFLDTSVTAKAGDLLAEKAWIVNGELIEAEVEKFLRERLQAVSSKR